MAFKDLFIKARKIRNAIEDKIKNVVANADYQQLLNNICCARSQFENLINETAYLINSATTREEVDTLQLPTDFSFLDIRG